MSVMYPSEDIEQSWTHGFGGQQRSPDWICVLRGGQHIDGAGWEWISSLRETV